MPTRIRVVSDLLLDPVHPPAPRADAGAQAVLIAGMGFGAGDASLLPRLLERIFPEAAILALPGLLDERLGPAARGQIERFEKACLGTRVASMHRRVRELPDGALVVGASLWTDFELMGRPRMGEAFAEERARLAALAGAGLADAARPEDIRAWHLADRAWIAEQAHVHHGRRLVCLTHHAPRRESLVGEARAAGAAARASHLPDAVFAPYSLWIHGRVQTNSDHLVGRCRVLCNPHWLDGTDGPSMANPGFAPDLLVEA